MRILLVFPPQGHFTQPYLALPSLRAYLESQGFDDVHVMDANIEAYEYFLQRERLEQSYMPKPFGGGAGGAPLMSHKADDDRDDMSWAESSAASRRAGAAATYAAHKQLDDDPQSIR